MAFIDQDLGNGNFKWTLINLNYSVYYFCDRLDNNSANAIEKI